MIAAGSALPACLDRVGDEVHLVVADHGDVGARVAAVGGVVVVVEGLHVGVALGGAHRVREGESVDRLLAGVEQGGVGVAVGRQHRHRQPGLAQLAQEHHAVGDEHRGEHRVGRGVDVRELRDDGRVVAGADLVLVGADHRAAAVLERVGEEDGQVLGVGDLVRAEHVGGLVALGERVLGQHRGLDVVAHHELVGALAHVADERRRRAEPGRDRDVRRARDLALGEDAVTDRADQVHGAVVDQLLRDLGRLGDVVAHVHRLQLERAAEHAAVLVDLVDGELRAFLHRRVVVGPVGREVGREADHDRVAGRGAAVVGAPSSVVVRRAAGSTDEGQHEQQCERLPKHPPTSQARLSGIRTLRGANLSSSLPTSPDLTDA